MTQSRLGKTSLLGFVPALAFVVLGAATGAAGVDTAAVGLAAGRDLGRALGLRAAALSAGVDAAAMGGATRRGGGPLITEVLGQRTFHVLGE